MSFLWRFSGKSGLARCALAPSSVLSYCSIKHDDDDDDDDASIRL